MFDNIQEGLFSSTPEGRFIEVNDALVACWDMPAEELLQVDIPTQVYSPRSAPAPSRLMEEQPHAETSRPRFAAKTGSAIYVPSRLRHVR